MLQNHYAGSNIPVVKTKKNGLGVTHTHLRPLSAAMEKKTSNASKKIQIQIHTQSKSFIQPHRAECNLLLRGARRWMKVVGGPPRMQSCVACSTTTFRTSDAEATRVRSVAPLDDTGPGAIKKIGGHILQNQYSVCAGSNCPVVKSKKN